VLQEPVGQYPAGPIWAIRLESGALGVNYNMAGNFGPWQSLNDAPISLYDTDLTLAAEQFADFTVTPNQP
jgi:hypothetical protein